MTPTDQLAHFSGGTDDLSTSGLWYSHKRVAQLVEAARAEGAADAEKALARVRALVDDWESWQPMTSPTRDDLAELRTALDGVR